MAGHYQPGRRSGHFGSEPTISRAYLPISLAYPPRGGECRVITQERTTQIPRRAHLYHGRGHVGVTCGSRVGPMGATWGSCGGHVWVTCRSRVGHMGATWGSCGGHMWVTCGSRGVTWGSHGGHVVKSTSGDSYGRATRQMLHPVTEPKRQTRTSKCAESTQCAEQSPTSPGKAGNRCAGRVNSVSKWGGSGCHALA